MKKRWKSKKYTDWVKSLDCPHCDYTADDPHHIIGYGLGGMGTKADDILTMPVCRIFHNMIHNGDVPKEDQILPILKTIIRAVREGVIIVK